MKHIRQQDIADRIKSPHRKAERKRLLQALREGGHTEAQKRYLEDRLSNLDAPRVYSTQPITPPWAIELPKEVRVDLQGATFESLTEYRITDLLKKATTLGMTFSANPTKAQVIKALLQHGKTS